MKVKIYILFIILVTLLLVNEYLIYTIPCNNNLHDNHEDNHDTKSISNSKEIQEFRFTLADYYKNNDTLSKLTDSIFTILSDYDKISQMIVSPMGTNGYTPEKIMGLIKKRTIGGVMLFGGTYQKFYNDINKIKKISIENKLIPLLFFVDGEPSLINKRISNIPSFSKKEEDNNFISTTLKNLGINYNLAPVVDDSRNVAIGPRGYGSNDTSIISHSFKFIKEMQSNNIVATLKHFPGHGKVKGDSHNELVYIDGKMEEINKFKILIDSGVISIMVGHISVINNDKYNTGEFTSSTSSIIMQKLLRDSLKFNGLIITDAMNMKGVINVVKDRPSFKAAIAGADLILMPTDENMLLISILNKYSNDSEFKKQINNSIKRIIRLKICLNLFNN
jgi:beta-N-acetylhexosaminidase